jgi:UDP-2,4-diacetamido-2,4,6-trideoxy-beta-L-altropyranose hydrolase
MRVVFRADASDVIATGHVMRCLTLAETLRERGAEVHFVSRDLPGNLNGLIAERGFGLGRLPEPDRARPAGAAVSEAETWLGVDIGTDAEQTAATLDALAPVDWLVVDHYGIDASWERLQRPRVGRILAIDDLANRAHDCDLLLDQNLAADAEIRYRGKVPPHCVLRLGPGYALLRREFRLARTRRRPRPWPPRRILVNFGGTDPSDLTALALAALSELDDARLGIDVVTGAAYRGRPRDIAGLPGLTWHSGVNTMAEMMASADLALGAGGGTTWERLYLGLPTMAVASAANQVDQLEMLADRDCIHYLGRAQDLDVARLTERLRDVLRQPAWPHRCRLEVASRTVADDMLAVGAP